MIGQRMRKLRTARGWSLEEAAKRISIPRGTYAGYEYDQRGIPNNLLPKIADVYGVTVDYLTRGQESKDTDDDLPLTPQEKARLKELLSDPKRSYAFRDGLLGPKGGSMQRRLLRSLEILAEMEEEGKE